MTVWFKIAYGAQCIHEKKSYRNALSLTLFSVSPNSRCDTGVRGLVTLSYFFFFYQKLLYSMSQGILVVSKPFTSRYLSCHSYTTSGIHSTSPSNPALRPQVLTQSLSIWVQRDSVAWSEVFPLQSVLVSHCYCNK